MKAWTSCSLKEQIERWENVARVLTNLSPHERRKHWDMREWGYKNECGTVACAAGHCGLDPWFNRRKFKLTFITEEQKYWDDTTKKILTKFIDIAITDTENFNVEKFFGRGGTNFIFTNTDTRPVSHVIKEVGTFIKYLKKRSKPDRESEEYDQPGYYDNLQLPTYRSRH